MKSIEPIDEWLVEYAVRYGTDGYVIEPWSTDAAQIRKDFMYRKGLTDIPGTEGLEIVARRVHYIVEPVQTMTLGELDEQARRQQEATDAVNYRW